MNGTFVRTSVTVDEAVAILLGWSTGPILYSSVNEVTSEEEQAVLESLYFSLADEIEERKDFCEGALAEAKIDGCSKSVIAEKHAAIAANDLLTAKANAYLCAVEDEINKGEQSALRVDRKLTNALLTYVTLSSLDEWAKNRYSVPILLGVGDSTSSTVAPKSNLPIARTKMRDQEEAILRVIQELGYAPKSLPRNQPGKSGAKAAVNEKLLTDPLFAAKTSFDRCWERLRKDKSIADSA